MEITLEYCSVACGRTPHSASWHTRTGTLAFVADRSVGLAEITPNDDVLKITGTLHGHTDKVNCVHWITCRGSRELYRSVSLEVISGSVDKTIRVWRRRNEGQEFECCDILVGHTHSVTCVAATYSNQNTMIYSASSDSTISIWKREINEDKFNCIQMLNLGRGFVFGMDCYLLHDTVPMLVCGGDDSKVHIFTADDNECYSKVLALAGHEDWVRSIHMVQDDSGDILIGSASQDTYIRLWRVTNKAPPTDSDELQLRGNCFAVGESSLSVTLEAVLCGHEDWVYSICWEHRRAESKQTRPLCLLSASMDKTMILWRPDEASGVWLEQVRVGDVGGNTLGLYGGIFGPTGGTILSHGYQGAFHIWEKQVSEDEVERWQPMVGPSGHYGPVQDMCWERGGRYLLSVSSDQTCRLHAPWIRDKDVVRWAELARPQVHGYDMTCVAMTTSLQYVSGADEKVLRVFEAPRNFVGNLSTVSGFSMEVAPKLPLGASVPALGLSNKAVFNAKEVVPDTRNEDMGTKNIFSENVPIFTPVDLTEPPIEGHLLQNTLWPEVQKLYGHGYELYCVAASSDGQYVASACKASKLEYAAIRIWSTLSWKQVDLLEHHSLTVTQLSFSGNGALLLAVSRDRTWSLWNRNEDTGRFVIIGQMDKSSKAHSRIIWSCGWSHDDACFATASRDKRVCIWSKHSVLTPAQDCGRGWKLASTPLELHQPVTAVSFAPISDRNRYLVAVGLENGEIILFTHDLTSGMWSPPVKTQPFLSHTSTVRRLQWQPSANHASRTLLLGSCSYDHSVRILKITLPND